MKKRVTFKSNILGTGELKTTFKDDFVTTDTWRIFRIMSAFVDWFEALSKVKRGVSFFGSKSTPRNHRYYKLATDSAYLLTKIGYSIITGSVNGLMEAANKGSFKSKEISLG